jgi:hypothetical protein
VIAEENVGAVGVQTVFFQVFPEQSSRLGPEGTDPLSASFPMQENTGRRGEVKITSLQIRDFADARAGVKQQTQQDQIASSPGRRRIDCLQDRLNLVGLEGVDWVALRAFERHAQDTLHLFEVLWVLRTHKSKEAMDSAQSDVAGAGQALPLGFEMLEESKNLFRCHCLDIQSARILIRTGQELQQEFEAVAIAAKGMWAERLLLRQKLSKEAVQSLAQD